MPFEAAHFLPLYGQGDVAVEAAGNRAEVYVEITFALKVYDDRAGCGVHIEIRVFFYAEGYPAGNRVYVH